jgi:hypothetical protein
MIPPSALLVCFTNFLFKRLAHFVFKISGRPHDNNVGIEPIGFVFFGLSLGHLLCLFSTLAELPPIRGAFKRPAFVAIP